MAWGDDPELVATFRAEVEDRLASMRDGLLGLEQHPSSRQVVVALFRDAHTVKGSARMLGLDGVVTLAHRAEDLLGMVRDGRTGVRSDLVDLLLVTTDALGRSLPGADRPVSDAAVAEVVAALDSALAGADPVTVPRLADLEPPAAEADDDVAATGRSGDHVRVPTRRVHGLLDVVGEAELEVRRMEKQSLETSAALAEQQALVHGLRSALRRHATYDEISAVVTALVSSSDRLEVATRDLRAHGELALGRLARVREGAMGLAMVPMRRVVAGFPALVREVASSTGKDVELIIEGSDVELDVRVLDAVADALRHLVTNAVDHGCETPDLRAAIGKPRRGIVTLRARQAGSTVVVEVSDDGNGIDDDELRSAAERRGVQVGEALTPAALHRVLFEPGFSTRTTVTETSGRGVGLDVVRSAVEGLGGTVDVDSVPGQGTTFVLTLPVTLGVVRCLVVRCGDERYGVPLPGVLETVSLRDSEVHDVAGVPVVVRHDEPVPLADLGRELASPGERRSRVAVLARTAGETLAWAVDEVEGEREVVVKPLGDFLGHVPGTSGATIDDDGSVLLLVDLRELAARRGSAPAATTLVDEQPAGDRPRATAAPDEGTRPRVLVVEDSVGVRELQRTILEGAGYEVLTAVDGLDGAAHLQQAPVDLVLSDVEMPGMDGFTLTRTIRRTRGWENVPVVIMTSRGDDADKRAGLDAGADAYLLKSEFDQDVLVDAVRRLVGR
ncbi:MAG TPA: response regulator [Candidatus Nanopelagicales bacterium]|nr:response regulator [Candidatus Nanopelagicales bacterium]